MNSINFSQVVCAALLIAIVLALIFSPPFRRDFIKGEGSAKVFGILSVEGAVVVLLCGLFLGGLLCSIDKNNNPDKNKISSHDDEIKTLRQENAWCQDECSKKNKEVLKLKQECLNIAKQHIELRMKKPDNAYKVKLFQNAAEQYQEIVASLPSCLIPNPELLADAENSYKSQKQKGGLGWQIVCDKYRLILSHLTL